ncbi:MAG: class I SAM-dependent methyltransferase [Pseudomonadota bacterium]
MSDESESGRHPAIRGGLSLDGDPEHIKHYYRQWADAYDSDVASASYSAARITSECLLNAPPDSAISIDLGNRDIMIHDAGCGTGLVGEELHGRGYHNLEGSDLTPEMVEVARERGVYRRLWGEVDITLPPRSEWLQRYDAITCCGVFTCGHVPPESLLNLLAMVKVGGLVVVSTRTLYYDDSQYQLANDRFIEEGCIKLVDNLRDAPYTDDGNSHYWTYVRLR